ncbi:unnamed protein product, partial [Symbiodinium microadriaticum]
GSLGAGAGLAEGGRAAAFGTLQGDLQRYDCSRLAWHSLGGVSAAGSSHERCLSSPGLHHFQRLGRRSLEEMATWPSLALGAEHDALADGPAADHGVLLQGRLTNAVAVVLGPA